MMLGRNLRMLKFSTVSSASCFSTSRTLATFMMWMAY